MVMHEILIASRGGQGGVVSGKLLTLAAFYDDKASMTIPKYGAERRGAPITVGVRISDQPIKKHTPVVGPSYVVAFDPSVIPKLMDIGSLHSTNLILNSTIIPDWAQSLPRENIHLVDANAIAREAGLVRSGIVMVSTVMPAAFARSAIVLPTSEAWSFLFFWLANAITSSSMVDAAARVYPLVSSITCT